MNITFMIGNGFDINCGMKCRYTDVYKEYIKEPSKSNSIEKFKRDIDPYSKTWADFEVAMSKYLPKFSSEREFLLCLRDFKKYLKFYLNREDQQIWQRISNPYVINEVNEEVVKSFINFYQGISPNLSRIVEELFQRSSPFYRAITFNYTSTFDKLYNMLSGAKDKTVLHIHGSLANDDIILGMDNLEQLPNVPFEFSGRSERAFIKPAFNKQYDEVRFAKAITWIQSSTVICVYGLSLGESDFTWRNMLIKWLTEDDSRQLFLFDYNYSSLSDLTADEKMDYEEDAKEKLFDSWCINSDICKKLINQVHIPCGRNIFNMGLIIQKGLERYNTSEKEKIRLQTELESASVSTSR